MRLEFQYGTEQNGNAKPLFQTQHHKQKERVTCRSFVCGVGGRGIFRLLVEGKPTLGLPVYSSQMSVTCSEQYQRNIMKAQCSFRWGLFCLFVCFFVRNIFIMKHVFFQRDYSFHDLFLWDMHIFECITHLVFGTTTQRSWIYTLGSARVATARLAILGCLVLFKILAWRNWVKVKCKF